jgi:hypothetical protein
MVMNVIIIKNKIIKLTFIRICLGMNIYVIFHLLIFISSDLRLSHKLYIFKLFYESLQDFMINCYFINPELIRY